MDRSNVAEDDLWIIEADKWYGILNCLIVLAEQTYESWGGDDQDKHFVNMPLREAFERARADKTAMSLETDLAYVCDMGEATVIRLANAIATRLGEDPASHWSADMLATLVGWTRR